MNPQANHRPTKRNPSYLGQKQLRRAMEAMAKHPRRHHLLLVLGLVVALLGAPVGPIPAAAQPPPPAAGRVVAWGNNEFGQATVPATLHDVVAVAAGGDHSLALQRDGRVVAWGDNRIRQTNVPEGLRNVVAITAGTLHSLALQRDGRVVAWGWNGYGQTTVPTDIYAVVAVAAGEKFSMALQRDGTLRAWGQTMAPNELRNVVAIAAGRYHSLTLMADGTVMDWSFITSVPAGLRNVVAIAAGQYHSLTLQRNGVVIGWGSNDHGQITVPADLHDVVAIAAGAFHSLALQRDGTVVAWGWNGYGQTTVPADLYNVVAVAAGGYHNLALINWPPAAVNDGFTTTAGAPLRVTAPGVLQNDTERDWGQTLQAHTLKEPGNGTLMLNANGAFTYMPILGFSGTDHFLYQSHDGITTSNVATVTIMVKNQPPVASADAFTTTVDTPLTRAAPGVLQNDGDPDPGQPLRAMQTGDPSNGVLRLNTDGSFTYTPTIGFSGTDHFVYQAHDGVVGSHVTTVTLQVLALPPVNTAPVASSQTITTAHQSTRPITLTGADQDGDALTYALVTPPVHGMLRGTAPNLLYTPAADFSGADHFTFQVNDGQADSLVATVTIQVMAAPSMNTAPVAHSQLITTSQNVATRITLMAIDTEGDALSYQVVGSPVHGSLGGIAPDLVYTPTTGYSGADSFTFQVSDGRLTSAAVTITIAITSSPNLPPISQDDAFTVTHNSQDNPLAVLTNDSDPDGDDLTLTAVSPPRSGVAQIANGQLLYTPAAAFVGMDRFIYTISDGKMRVVATVTVTVIVPIAGTMTHILYLPLVRSED